MYYTIYDCIRHQSSTKVTYIHFEKKHIGAIHFIYYKKTGNNHEIRYNLLGLISKQSTLYNNNKYFISDNSPYRHKKWRYKSL